MRYHYQKPDIYLSMYGELLMNVPGEGVLPPLAVLETTIDTLNVYRKLYLGTLSPDGSIGIPENRKDIWWQMIQLLPSSYNQTRNVMMNYEVLANIYKSRRITNWTSGGASANGLKSFRIQS